MAIPWLGAERLVACGEEAAPLIALAIA